MGSQENADMIYEYLLENTQLHLCSRLCLPKINMTEEEKLKFFFHVFDPQRSGFISKEEFVNFFIDFGMIRWAIEESVSAWNYNEDGKMDFESFKTSLDPFICKGFDLFLLDIRLDHGLLQHLESLHEHTQLAQYFSLFHSIFYSFKC